MLHYYPTWNWRGKGIPLFEEHHMTPNDLISWREDGHAVCLTWKAPSLQLSFVGIKFLKATFSHSPFSFTSVRIVSFRVDLTWALVEYCISGLFFWIIKPIFEAWQSYLLTGLFNPLELPTVGATWRSVLIYALCTILVWLKCYHHLK